MKPMDENERKVRLNPLLKSGWAMADGRDAITKSFRFKNFRKAFAWMTEMAMWAEKMDHHPEWYNVYNEMSVTLQTHVADGITQLDTDLARRMDAAWEAI